MSKKYQNNLKTAATKGIFNLVSGDYSPAEASEIVNDLFFKKINFFEVKNFSQLIRFGCKSSSIEDQIAEIKKAQLAARELITEASEAGKVLRVQSTISIELI
jgi:hypothetical protein